MNWDTQKIESWINDMQGIEPMLLWHELAEMSIGGLRQLSAYLNISNLFGETNRPVLMDKIYIHLLKEGIVKCNH